MLGVSVHPVDLKRIVDSDWYSLVFTFQSLSLFMSSSSQLCPGSWPSPSRQRILRQFYWCLHTAEVSMAGTLTHWGRDKMVAIYQTFSNGFFLMKMHVHILLLKFHRCLFLGIPLTIFQHWFRQWLGTDQATSHCLNQWWLNLLPHLCVSASMC